MVTSFCIVGWLSDSTQKRKKMHGYVASKQWRLKIKYNTETRISFGRK